MGVEIVGPMNERYGEILAPEALDLLAGLHREFDGRRLELLERRKGRAEFGFLAETQRVREDRDWRVADPAPGLVDRRVEITGPTDAKMTINALNSGAKVWMADHEDANTPLWENVIGGQLNLKDAAAGKLAFTSPRGQALRGRRGSAADGGLPAARLAPEREAYSR